MLNDDEELKERRDEARKNEGRRWKNTESGRWKVMPEDDW